MARTVLNAKVRIKGILKDRVDPLRYPETDLLNAINDALVEVRRCRPDLFLKRNFAVPQLVNDSDVLPIEDQYFNSVVWFATGYMMLRDDEFTVDGRGMTLINKATAQLLESAA